MTKHVWQSEFLLLNTTNQQQLTNQEYSGDSKTNKPDPAAHNSSPKGDKTKRPQQGGSRQQVVVQP